MTNPIPSDRPESGDDQIPPASRPCVNRGPLRDQSGRPSAGGSVPATDALQRSGITEPPRPNACDDTLWLFCPRCGEPNVDGQTSQVCPRCGFRSCPTC